MARKSIRTGTGRVALSLGAADPRIRRGADASQDPEQQIGRGLRVGRRGQFEVAPAARIAPHGVTVERADSAIGAGDGSTLGTLTSSHDALVLEHRKLLSAHNELVDDHRALSEKLAELIRGLERAGFLEGGR